MQGTIESMRTERGFGFLRDSEGTEVFFHQSVVTPADLFVSLAVGMVVEFEAEAGPKGLRATQVTMRPGKRR
jgi:cold shock CspA family protein